ncbi:MAG: hypothetical protein EXR11_06980 [Rhodospirillaceae bacterium]|nr:hypothetical protein [Rhodospirillaceae bacterium]
MITKHTLTAIALVLGLAAAPMAAQAAEGTPAKSQATSSADVKAELAKLKKVVGAGELSSKDYKARKEALEKGTQTAKSDGK